jgi:hypothetical protein
VSPNRRYARSNGVVRRVLGAVGWDGPDTRDSGADSDEDEEEASTHSVHSASTHSATELIQAAAHASHSPHGSNSSPRGLEHKGVSTAVNLAKSSASVPTQVPQKVEQEP